MRLEGNRQHDAQLTMMSAWEESDFRDYFYARNKASLEEHAKKIFVDPDTVEEMHARIDADHAAQKNPPRDIHDLIERVRAGRPVWPSMKQLRELKALGPEGQAVLAKIPMFPSSRGRPYSYSAWNNYYIRPALQAAPEARIASTAGYHRPTPIWLRRSMYSERVGHILTTSKSDAEIDQRFRKLAKDKGLANTGPIYRYAHSAFPTFFAKGQAERAQQDHARVLGGFSQVPQGGPPDIGPKLSAATQSFRSRAPD